MQYFSHFGIGNSGSRPFIYYSNIILSILLCADSYIPYYIDVSARTSAGYGGSLTKTVFTKEGGKVADLWRDAGSVCVWEGKLLVTCSLGSMFL